MTSSRSTLGQRVAVSVVGTLIALAMIALGLWQMQVFEAQGDKDAARRSTADPVELVPLIPTDGSVGDVYGRNVRVRGTFQPDETVVVTDSPTQHRVVTALLLSDGRVLPVVRGTLPTNSPPPPPPGGPIEITGVFLPSEAAGAANSDPADLSSVRLPVLQQRWTQQLTPGFVTLSAPEAGAQGLSPAAVTLPSQDGKFRNFGYALQWWVFAAFAVVMTVVWVRTLRARERRDGATQATA